MAGVIVIWPLSIPIHFRAPIFQEFSMPLKWTKDVAMIKLDKQGQKPAKTVMVADKAVMVGNLSQTVMVTDKAVMVGNPSQKLQDQLTELEDLKKNLVEAIKENTDKELVVIDAMQRRIVAMKELTQHLHKQQKALQKQHQKEIEILEVKKEWQKEIEILEVKKEWQKKIEISEEERQHLVHANDTLTTRVAELLSEREHLVKENDTLATKIEKLSNEKDCLTESLKQAKDETRSLAQQNRRTISDMGILWLMRVLCPRHLAVDGCFFIFSMAFLYNRMRKAS